MYDIAFGSGVIVLYFLITASTALILRKSVHIRDEIFRKGLHFILLGSLLVWVLSFSVWWHAALTSVCFALVLYPVLCLTERIKGFSAFVTERKSGELKLSLLIVFAMFSVVVSVCWGWLNDKMLVLASIYAWGFGDAAAALVGKRFGKHAITGKHIEGRKSAEGSFAMFITSLICVGVILLIRGSLPWYGYVVIPVLTAAGTAAVELFSLKGTDTVTCPLTAMAIILPSVYLIGGTI